MPEEIRQPDGQIEHPNVRHERRDVKLRWIVGLILGATATATVLHYLIWLFFTSQTSWQNYRKRTDFPLSHLPGRQAGLPEEPRLDPLNLKEHVEKANVHDRELNHEEQLQGLGPTSNPDYVHIPIERAMDLLADKLPVAPQPSERLSQRSNGLLDAGEPNSGRILRDRALWYER
jgi:hypothetical protein